MSTMTLEQVRDMVALHIVDGDVANSLTLRAIHEAIDDHLAAREADAVVVVSGSDLVVGRESRSLHWLTKDPYSIAPGTRLYAAPVAQEAAAPAEQPSCDGLIGYVHPALLDGNSLAMEVSRVRLSDAQLPVYTTTTTRPAVAAPDLSDRYRALMEAQVGVTDEMVERALKILHGSRHPHPKDGQAWCDARDVLEMGAALAAHPHTGYSAVSDGWKIVPVEPTTAMSAAGFCVSEAEHDPAGVYRAMLAAAPEVDRG